MRSLTLALLTVFVPLSLVSVGGGQSIVAGIHRQVVENHHWLTGPQFVDAFAIARMAPGPGTLLVTLIGWQVDGAWGALIASIGIFTPTALLIYGLARIWARYRGALWQRALEAGLQPIAAGMILAAGLVLVEALEGGWLARIIAVAATGVLMITRVSPLLLMAVGAVVFVSVHTMAGFW
jgi:chromate transporter